MHQRASSDPAPQEPPAAPARPAPAPPDRATGQRTDPAVVVGFAVGVGLVFVATVGVYWHFWRPAATVWTWGVGSFAIGAALGAIYAALRRVRL